MPTARPCIVSFTDSEGIRHTAQVTAASLYEAAALALQAFRAADLIAAVPGRATTLAVRVTAPATTHEVSVGKLQDWLSGGGKSPREHALKTRLRDLLA